MNTQNYNVLLSLAQNPYINQRELAERLDYSLGMVNQALKDLVARAYLDAQMQLTSKAQALLKQHKPQRAVILAAGFGTRMVPINLDTPKALLEVNGETLIERLIKQLHEVGIEEIDIVVGFMKEKFQYLIDQYGVNLVVNVHYITTNNLYSLALVRQKLNNAYIVPSDIWCAKNPFNHQEIYSWYMVSDQKTKESNVKVTKQQHLVKVSANALGNRMIGIAYLTETHAQRIEHLLQRASSMMQYEQAFWEALLLESVDKTAPFYARVVQDNQVVEINTYEDLRELDDASVHLQAQAIELIAQHLEVSTDDITDITVLKKGMTNRSFYFTCLGNQYIMRIPGEGTEQLLNRYQEAHVYRALAAYDICDPVFYIDAETGYKLSQYFPNSRTADAANWQDVAACMAKLKSFHELKLSVPHTFDLFEQMEFYERLRGKNPSRYKDYAQTKAAILSLKPFVESFATEKVLTHIDAISDNFLFVTEDEGQQSIRLIDWEYAGMQDPHVDLAMFAIYAFYEREDIDRLIDCYFDGECSIKIRLKIYAYVAICGLLWSNWCEYKHSLGVEFAEYSLKQYGYAKTYYKIVQKCLEELGETDEHN
ncbi:MAG: phosphotransferase [Aerococcaceae bacterium]|nr:phosphotransferase [Aerococcaceae bacterium]